MLYKYFTGLSPTSCNWQKKDYVTVVSLISFFFQNFSIHLIFLKFSNSAVSKWNKSVLVSQILNLHFLLQIDLLNSYIYTH